MSARDRVPPHDSLEEAAAPRGSALLPDASDCVFFRIAVTDEEKARAVRELDEQRTRATRIRDSYDRGEERAYHARVQRRALSRSSLSMSSFPHTGGV